MEACQRQQHFAIYEGEPDPWFLNFIITAEFPLARVRNDPGSHHVHINVNQALLQVPSAFNRSGMVSILPESTHPIFPLVILLSRSPRYQLY